MRLPDPTDESYIGPTRPHRRFESVKDDFAVICALRKIEETPQEVSYRVERQEARRDAFADFRTARFAKKIELKYRVSG